MYPKNNHQYLELLTIFPDDSDDCAYFLLVFKCLKEVGATSTAPQHSHARDNMINPLQS